MTFYDFKNKLFIYFYLQFGATLGAGGVGLVKLEEGGEVGHLVAVATLYRGCRGRRVHRNKAGAADELRAAQGEIHVTGVVAGDTLLVAADLPGPGGTHFTQELIHVDSC